MARQPLRAVIYARESKISDAERKAGLVSRSVDEQEVEERAVCERQGWSVVKVFREPDRSASRFARKERPQYDETVKWLRAGKADVLVCWESSRAQRDLAAYVKLRDVCAETGTLYSYKGQTYDLSKGEDRFRTGLDALLDERSSEETSSRVLRALRANAESGKPHSQPLYGYRREYDSQSGEYVRTVIEPEQSRVVQEAARRLLHGEAQRSIARDFQARRIPTARGGKWAGTNLVRMVLNPGYAGLRVHQGQVVGSAGWEPILSVDDHQRLVALLGPEGRPKRDTSGAPKHLLSGIARCGKQGCENRLYAMSSTSLKNQRVYTAKPCLHVSRKAGPLEKHVTSHVIIAACVSPNGPELLRLESSRDDMESARAELEALRKRMDGFYDQAASGKLSDAGLAAMEARLLPQIEELQQASRTDAVPEVVYDTVYPDSDVVWGRWRSLSLADKRTLIRALVDIVVYPTMTGRRPFNPDDVKVYIRYTEA